MSKKHIVRSYYDQYAENYDNFYKPIQREKFLHLHSYIQKEPILFDLGGGSGVICDWIDGFVINFDISIKMLRKGLNLRSYQAIASDLENIPARRGSIQNLISFTAIQNTENVSRAIEELDRVSTTDLTGVVSFLRKSVSLDELEQLFLRVNLKFEHVPGSNEDYCFSIMR